MARQSLNEDRGARRAAALKNRFRSVSERSIGRRAKMPSLGNGGGGRSIAIWAAIGLIAFLVGSLLN